MIKVIDDIVSKSFADSIFEMTLKQDYEYNPKTLMTVHYDIENKCYSDDNVYDNGQEVCLLANNNHIIKEQEIVNHLIEKAKKEVPKIAEIERIKINRLQKIPKEYKQKYNTPHTDFPDVFTNHYSMIYYCNDSDGFTYIFNEFHNPLKVPKKLTINQKVKPRKGRVVIFESNRWHSSSNPIVTDQRVIINFIFKTTEIEYNQNILNQLNLSYAQIY